MQQTIEMERERRMALWEMHARYSKWMLVDLDGKSDWVEKKTSTRRFDCFASAFRNEGKYDCVAIRSNFHNISLLETVYTAVDLLKQYKVLFSTSGITQAGAGFLRRIGITAIVSESNVFSFIENFIRQSQVPFFTSADILRKDPATGAKKTPPYFFDFTAAEIEVLYLISRGCTNPQISSKLNRSYHTIKNHKANIVRKAGLDGCNQLPALAVQLQNANL